MVKGTNKDGESSIYNFNALGVLINHSDRVNKDYVVDYTSFVTRELVETQDQDNGLNLRYAYAGLKRISANIVSNDDKVKMFYHNDRLGSAVLATDNIGKVRAKANYDEWGNRSKVQLSKIGINEVDLVKSYIGHNFDEILGVYYAKARLYSAKNKRFSAEDIFKGLLEIHNRLWYFCIVLITR